jgi:NTE family protein
VTGKRVFILGGGAALGAHQVGALKYLAEQGLTPDAFVASSIGVLNACVYASGGITRLEEAWRDFRSIPRIFSPSLWQNPLFGLSLFSMDRLSSALEEFIDFPELFASPLEMEFVVLNLSRGRGEMHAKHSCNDWRELRTLTRAGYAIPMLFPPIQFRGDWYVDGGFAWNIPLERAIQMGATEIYLLAPIASQCPTRVASARSSISCSACRRLGGPSATWLPLRAHAGREVPWRAGDGHRADRAMERL